LRATVRDGARGGSEITRAQEEEEGGGMLLMALPVMVRWYEGEKGCLFILAAFGHRIFHGSLERIFRKAPFFLGAAKTGKNRR